jgi:hypothetical protein
MLETSRFNEERQVDVTIGMIKRLKMYGLEQYNQAMKDDAKAAISYWDGYMRALTHVIEAEME